MARRVLSCRPSMVVQCGFPRLSLRLLLSDRLGLIDSAHARSQNAAKHTPGKSRCWDWGQGFPGCLAKEGARADNKYTHRPWAPLNAVGAATGNPTLPTWFGSGLVLVHSRCSLAGLGLAPAASSCSRHFLAAFAANTSWSTMNSSAYLDI